MSMERLRLAVIIGSVRQGRFGPVVAQWVAQQAEQHGAFTVDVIDLADFDVPTQLPALSPAMKPDLPRPPQMADLTRRLADADAYVIVTPDYNRGVPASLKAAIDWYYAEWHAKAVGMVGYSGNSGGLLAIEQLRQIFNELHTHTVREYVSFPRYYLLWGPSGALLEPDGPEAAATLMLDQLRWWGGVLRDARRDHPYVSSM